ncbi:MAG: hypothetical protein AB1540_05705 [Bdellovibrionota bacterium]
MRIISMTLIAFALMNGFVESSEAAAPVTIIVEAKVGDWQRTNIILTNGQEAVITVPHLENDEPQRWGITDPKNRKPWNTYWGNGVRASKHYKKRGAYEGALLVSLVGQEKDAVAFEERNQKITIKGPGEIQFMANDDIHPRKIFVWEKMGYDYHNGFSDNEGSLNVVVLKTNTSTLTQPQQLP